MGKLQAEQPCRLCIPCLPWKGISILAPHRSAQKARVEWMGGAMRLAFMQIQWPPHSQPISRVGPLVEHVLLSSSCHMITQALCRRSAFHLLQNHFNITICVNLQRAFVTKKVCWVVKLSDIYKIKILPVTVLN